MENRRLDGSRDVLLVDDGAFFASMLAEALQGDGFRVTHVPSVEGVSRVVEEGLRPELVLMKLELPDFPGDVACQEMRTMPEFQGVPLLLYSSEEEHHGVARARACGATGFLAKPFAPSRVLEWAHANREHFSSPETLAPPPPHQLGARPLRLERLTVPAPAPTREPSRRILLVDDNVLILDALRMVLDAAGYELETAADWPEFRSAVLSERFALILLDVQLPQISGEKLALFVRDFLEPPRPRVLLYSGLPEPRLAALAERVGADGYVCKGPSAKELLARVGRLLDD